MRSNGCDESRETLIPDLSIVRHKLDDNSPGPYLIKRGFPSLCTRCNSFSHAASGLKGSANSTRANCNGPRRSLTPSTEIYQ